MDNTSFYTHQSTPSNQTSSTAGTNQRLVFDTQASASSLSDTDVTFVTDSRSRDRTAKYLDDPQAYFETLETEDTVKCVVSSVLFLVIIIALFVTMFLYHPQM